ncbi:GPI mannosyltransferase 2 [Diachasmimorpha longicaudata]|uniref:GPI mannosyltransferase 2 n=1 Tax=Diachasmimorpha longicaudata TaxID=58733 RepID=UPI0030B8ABEA
MQPRQKILAYAIVSRLIVIFLQLIFNSIIPDHEPEVFRTPLDPYENVSFLDKVVSFLFGGLTRWDSEYYIHIAKYGYTYENTLAFPPMYPMTVRAVAKIFRKTFFLLNYHSVITLSAIGINFFCFLKSALVLYDLTSTIWNQKFGYKVALLYCVGPASIFFTAAYTESMFAYITFFAMLKSVQKNYFVSIPIGLSTLVRSNGLLNVGFPLYVCLQDIIGHVSMSRRINSEQQSKFLLQLSAWSKTLLKLCATIILSFTPFLLLQTYNYTLYCTHIGNSTYMPPHVRDYGEVNRFIMPGGDIPPWCHYRMPMSYFYIQNHYWNVGFMNYYELKQIPNFVLALPIMYFMFRFIYKYLLENWAAVVSMKVLTLDVRKHGGLRKDYPAKIFPFVVHGLFLTLFCIFYVHIQVSTRLLASASPILYWYAAIILTNEERNDLHYQHDVRLGFNIFFRTPTTRSIEPRLVIAYFTSYIFVGTIFYSNFLPWT